jgi:hypothetical protein
MTHETFMQRVSPEPIVAPEPISVSRPLAQRILAALEEESIFDALAAKLREVMGK